MLLAPLTESPATSKHFLAFLSFALPTMVKTVANKAIATDDSNTEAAEGVIALAEGDGLVDSFKSLETKVVALRNDLIGKVDIAIQEISLSNEKIVEEVNKKLEKLEANLDSNKSELTKISDQLSVIVDQTMVI